MPRIARKDQGELPKPVVKKGTLGFMPLNRLSVSCLYQGCGNVILASSEQAGTFSNAAIRVKNGKKAEDFNLIGIYFRGISDVFYRGKLPQVIIASPETGDMENLLDAMLDYIHKIVILGFVLNKRDPVEELVPNVVIAGSGIYYARFIARLGHALKSIPDVDDDFRKRVANKFVRGVFNPAPDNLALVEPVDLMPPPSSIRIAGGDSATREIVQSVLSLYGIVTVVENRTPNPAERLELEEALWRTETVILPLLEQANLLEQIRECVYAIGHRRKAFDPLEEALTKNKPVPANLKPGTDSLSTDDLSIVAGLRQYAEALQLEEAQSLFNTLGEKLVRHFKTQ